MSFRVSPQFYPIRLLAYSRNEVELTVGVENNSHGSVWTECDVIVPDPVSLAPDKPLQRGRLRIGIITPNETRQGRCKIYSGPKSYPGIYDIKLVIYGFGKDGAIEKREEKSFELRCESIGK
ncbi:MAG: hypothetical protein NT157_07030 [Candidatus Micrarchaeota archaeon]|nr:hypothetical protein [Candidatus Micrarchaeota archaeon]